MDVPVNYRTYFGDLLKNSDSIVTQIRDDVERLVEDYLLKEEPTNVLFVERKGLHLFHHTFNRLMEAGFSLGRVRFFKLGKHPLLLVKPRFEVLENVIICTDAINTGNEILTLLKTFQARDVSVKKVFCYYANSSSLSKLISQEFVGSDQIVYAHGVLEGESYSDLAKRLSIYFQSRIEPMDMDHVYDLFTLKPRFKRISDLQDILNSSASLFFGEGVEFERDDLAPKNVVGFSLEYPTDGSWNDLGFCLPPVLIKGVEKFCDISFLELRVKFERRRSPQNFTIMGYSQVEDVNTLGLSKVECPIESMNGTCLKNKIFYNKDAVSDEEIASRICTLCIENYSSSLALDKFENELISEFRRKSFQPTKRMRYHPISSLI